LANSINIQQRTFIAGGMRLPVSQCYNIEMDGGSKKSGYQKPHKQLINYIKSHYLYKVLINAIELCQWKENVAAVDEVVNISELDSFGHFRHFNN